jgi:hypothetical protein
MTDENVKTAGIGQEAPVVEPGHTYASVTEKISSDSASRFSS